MSIFKIVGLGIAGIFAVNCLMVFGLMSANNNVLWPIQAQTYRYFLPTITCVVLFIGIAAFYWLQWYFSSVFDLFRERKAMERFIAKRDSYDFELRHFVKRVDSSKMPLVNKSLVVSRDLAEMLNARLKSFRVWRVGDYAFLLSNGDFFTVVMGYSTAFEKQTWALRAYVNHMDVAAKHGKEIDADLACRLCCELQYEIERALACLVVAKKPVLMDRLFKARDDAMMAMGMGGTSGGSSGDGDYVFCSGDSDGGSSSD